VAEELEDADLEKRVAMGKRCSICNKIAGHAFIQRGFRLRSSSYAGTSRATPGQVTAIYNHESRKQEMRIVYFVISFFRFFVMKDFSGYRSCKCGTRFAFFLDRPQAVSSPASCRRRSAAH
jgi:hypothetical protein